MMTTSTLVIEKINETWIRLSGDDHILFELDDAFKFMIPNAKFNPKVKAKIWDGFIRLIQVYRRKTYVGLFPQILDFCKARNYEVVYNKNDFDKIKIEPADLVDYVKSLNLHSKNKKIEFKDYQYKALLTCLTEKRQIILSPTGSGKSAQIYSVVRFLQEDHKILIIVPTVGLVTQMVSDFGDYASEDPTFSVEDCHSIYSGKEKSSDKSVWVSTWQSIFRMPPDWFEQFDAVIVDEVHGAKSSSITGIMEKCINAKFKLGFTGSLDKALTHEQMLKALFGNVTRVAFTKDLIDQGHLSNIKIKAVLVKHPEADCKAYVKAEYKNEVMYIIGSERRNAIIKNLTKSLKGNVLILFNYVEKHGAVLNKMLSEAGCNTHFIHGGVDVDDRDAIKEIVEANNNVVVIASFGTFSTGVNLKNLHHVICASPTKSVIRVLQSIGRGLRKADGKDSFTWWDIADDMRYKSYENHCYKHFGERLKIYSGEQFEYSINEVKI